MTSIAANTQSHPGASASRRQFARPVGETPALRLPCATWARLATLAAALLFGELAAAQEAEVTFEHYLIAPLRIHLLVSAEDPDLCTSLTEVDILRIVGKVNGVWLQAGIAFVVESIVRETPEPDETPGQALPGDDRWLPRHIPSASYGPEQFQAYYLKRFQVNGIFYPAAVFIQDAASLRPVVGGLDEPIPRVTAHELGHALGLPHRQETFNLMASGTTGTQLNAAEIATVRAHAARMDRFKAGPEWLAEAGRLRSSGREAEALSLEQKLAALPLEPATLARLRARVGSAK